MPNHVSLRMKVTGPKAERQRFKTEVAGKDDDGEADVLLSFEKLIPYPEGFDKTATATLGTENFGKDAADYERMVRKNYAGYLKSNPETWKTIDIEERVQQDLKNRKVSMKNIEISGHADWYAWRVENWGTKWGAYSIEFSESEKAMTYEFQTAWSLPEPILDKLAEMFPKLTMRVDVCEEGGFFCGVYKASKGGGAFYDQPYPSTKEDHCPYHGTHDWIDDDEDEEEEEQAMS